jgi:hypothetical protein
MSKVKNDRKSVKTALRGIKLTSIDNFNFALNWLKTDETPVNFFLTAVFCYDKNPLVKFPIYKEMGHPCRCCCSGGSFNIMNYYFSVAERV